MMHIALREIEENELGDLLNPPDHLATTVYNLYCCPLSDTAPQRRAVILTDDRLRLETDPQAEEKARRLEIGVVQPAADGNIQRDQAVPVFEGGDSHAHRRGTGAYGVAEAD